MYDFIIFFEHQTRELENAVLLEEYLKSQGYSTCILRIDSYKMLYKRAKVIIAPYCYHNNDVFSFVSFPFYKPQKLINLQYEQIYTENDEKTGKLFPREIAKDCCIVTWGEHTYKNLINCGIDSSNLYKIGNFALDFNSDKFGKYFKTRCEIAEEFGLPKDKKWHLFISSFSKVNLEEEHVNGIRKFIEEIDRLIDYNVKSQIQIIDWFKRYLDEHNDVCIIYRPHPAENVSGLVYELEKKYTNFYVINEYSIRQWIRVSDSISNWYSTSLVDIYFANKTCFILRPISISMNEDVLIMKEAKFVTSYESFNKELENQEEVSFPIDTNIIKDFFYNSFDGECYKKLGDMCIDVLRDNKNIYDYKNLLGFSKMYYCKRYIWLVLMFFAAHVNISKILPLKYKSQLSYMYKESRDYTKKEKQIRLRLMKVVHER
jgi:surface carbohydrate biosynthesis protein